MKRVTLMVLPALVVSVVAADLVAANRVDNRQEAQRARIQQGIRDGSVTRQERQKLVREQRQIQRSENRAKADGNVTLREKVRLEKMQDKAGRDIYRQKHDQQMRDGKVVNARQEIQKTRIKEGVRSGELTKREAAGLVGQQKMVNAAEQRARKDGEISPKEAAVLDRMQDRASESIRNQKHDQQARNDAAPLPTVSAPGDSAPN